jgi:hypothetical protein
VNPDDVFALFAELSMALAGFAGVASAFSGREKDFGLLDQGRIRAIVGLAAIVLLGCLAFLSISLADLSVEQATRGAALASLAACVPLYAWVLVPADRDLRQPSSQAEPWVIHLSTILVCVATLSYGCVALFPTSLWLLGGTFSLQIAHALWMFLRLLTRA